MKSRNLLWHNWFRGRFNPTIVPALATLRGQAVPGRFRISSARLINNATVFTPVVETNVFVRFVWANIAT